MTKKGKTGNKKYMQGVEPEFYAWLDKAMKDDRKILNGLAASDKKSKEFEKWWKMFEKENSGMLDDLA